MMTVIWMMMMHSSFMVYVICIVEISERRDIIDEISAVEPYLNEPLITVFNAH